MNEVEILSAEKRQAIKDLLHCKDVGLSNFNYATICNHKLADADIITGFKGEGATDSIAVLNLIIDIWQDLTEEERKQIKNILESEVRE